ncbi:sensor histidine kinase [Intrasporangium sp.]|uniref:sensor histidine kinase n=1 Tax=Intrasporangium sp. TaxID=1925024 RepID=UPI00293B11B0|nr:histidine kinase [Intrasporangium sp.]MDV3219861.1 histidine kinase [Intrasporangium sp.]
MHEGSVYDWFQRRPLLVDVPLAVVLALITSAPFTGSLPGYWALLGLPILLLVVRRTRPALAFAAVSVALALRTIPVHDVLPGDLAFLPAIYSLAAYEPRRARRLAGLGVAAVGSVMAGVLFTSTDGAPNNGPAVLTTVACATAALSAWMLGDLKHTRLQRLADLRERAERVERERERELQLAAQEERAAIAREMHDVVAHALSVIVVQADGAAYAAERSPEDTRAQSVAALKTIGATARDALSETRRLVGVLRDPTTGAELAPAGGLEQLGELVERVRAAGVSVRVRDGLGVVSAPVAPVPGSVVPEVALPEVVPGTVVPVGVGLAAYRLVQEGLTNVIKHAGPGAAASVVLEGGPDGLRVTVSDNGMGDAAPDDGRGHGLPGMRERVAVHGGVLTAGPRPGGGWEVSATLPTMDGSRGTTTLWTTQEDDR